MSKKLKLFLMIISILLSMGLGIVGVFSLSSINVEANGNIGFGKSDYTVTFNTNGGKFKPGETVPSTYQFVSALSLPTQVYKTGYEFEGWYDNLALTGEKITQIPVYSRGNKVFYANYNATEYSISFNENGGTFSGGYSKPTYYTIESTVVTLPIEGNITKAGSSLEGWQETIPLTGNVNWTFGFINASTGAFEMSSTYPSSYFSDAIYLKMGTTYTLTTSMSDARWRWFKTDGTYGNTVSGKTFTPTENCYAHILYFNSSTETVRNQSYISSQVTTREISPGSTGDRVYTAKWALNKIAAVLNANGGLISNTALIYGADSYVATDHNINWSKNFEILGSFEATSTGRKSIFSSYPAANTLNLELNAAITGFRVYITDNSNVTRVDKDYDFGVAKLNEVMQFSISYNASTKIMSVKVNGTTVSIDQTINLSSYTLGECANHSIINADNRGSGTFTPLKIGAITVIENGSAIFNYAPNSTGMSNTITGQETTITGSFTRVGFGFTQHVYQYNEQYGTLPNPTKAGHTFGGWYLDQQFTNAVLSTTLVTATTSHMLYAKWTANTYTISYRYNISDTTSVYTTQNVVYGNITSAPTPPTREGYNFEDWYLESGCINQFNFGSVLSENTILYAKWTAKSYSVRYNSNGGTGSMSNSQHVVDVSKALTQNTFVKTGHSFAGWAKTAGGAVQYLDRESVVNLSTIGGAIVDLYAVWTPMEYTVIFNANEGYGEMENQTFTYDVWQNLTANQFLKTGHEFLGWSTNSAATSATYVDCENVKNLTATESTVELFAVWNILSFTASVNPSGGVFRGSTGITNIVGEYKSTVVIDPTRTGYTIKSMQTTKGSLTPNKIDNVIVSYTFTFGAADATITVTWQAIDVTLNYYSTGAYGNRTTTAKYDSSVTLPTDSKAGTVFDGWFTAATGGTKYNSPLTITTVTPINLYAQFTTEQYTITYNPNGGTVSPTSQTVTYGQTITIPTPTKTGYHIYGWEIQNGGYDVWFDEISTSLSGDGTEQNPYLIQSGADLAYLAQEHNAGRSSQFTGKYFSQTTNIMIGGDYIPIGNNYNNSFKGIYNGNGHLIDFDSSLYVTNDDNNKYGGVFGYVGHQNYKAVIKNMVIRIAVFGEDKSIIGSVAGFVRNGIVSNIASNLFAYVTPGDINSGYVGTIVGGAQNYTDVMINNCMGALNTNCGTFYAIAGGNGFSGSDNSYYINPQDYSENFSWETMEAVMQDSIIQPGAYVFKFGYSITLTAVWIENQYSVKYNANGGTGTMANTEHTYGVSQNLRANAFTRIGYTFAGWARSAGGAVEFANSASVINLTTEDNVTVNLYAIWTPIQYTVTFNSNGGYGQMDDQIFTYGIEQNITVNAFARTGHTFLGWSKVQSATSATYLDNASVLNLTDEAGVVELFAIWEIQSFTLTVNPSGGVFRGSTGTTDIVGQYGTTVVIDPTRTGYTIKSMQTTKGTLTKNEVNGVIQSYTFKFSASNATVTVTWQAVDVTINYYSTGAYGNKTVTVKYDSSVNLPADEKTGAVFNGWFTAASGGTKYNSPFTVNSLGPINLYAQFTTSQYTINYNADGGTVSPTSQTVTYGQTINIPAPTKTGYTFNFWDIQDGHSTWMGEISASLSGAGTEANPYLIQSGADLAYLAQEHNAGRSAQFSGKYFLQTVDILIGRPYTPIGNNYANSFKGIYNGNSHVIQFDTSVEVTNDDNNKYGGIFGFVGHENYKAIIKNLVVDISVFGQDKSIIGSVAGFVRNGVINNIISRVYAYLEPGDINSGYASAIVGGSQNSTDVTISNCMGAIGSDWHDVSGIARGYFNGSNNEYSVNSDSTSGFNWDIVELAIGELVIHSGTFVYRYTRDLNLIAVWNKNRYEVKYNANGGTGSMQNSSHIYDTAQDLTLNTFTRTGYTFAGWSTTSGGTVQYENGASVVNLTSSNNVTVNLYAVWAANELTFNSQTLGSGTYLSAYSKEFNGASNGTGSYSYSVVSGGIAGLTLTGKIFSGTITGNAGTYNIVVRATDNNSQATKDATITITVNKIQLANPTSVQWSTTSGRASWVSVSSAELYSVMLYAAGSLRATVTTTGLYYDFVTLLDGYSDAGLGTIYFTVAAVHSNSNYATSQHIRSNNNLFQLRYMTNAVDTTTIFAKEYYRTSQITVQKTPDPTYSGKVFNTWMTTQAGGTIYMFSGALSNSTTIWAAWYSAQARIGTTNYRYLSEAINAVPATGVATTVHLISREIRISSQITIPSTKNVVINVDVASGNYTIYRTSSSDTYTFFLLQGKLTISPNSTATITLDGEKISTSIVANSLIEMRANSVLDLKARVTLQYNKAENGAAIYKSGENAKITLDGAKIYKCYAVTSGGAIYVDSSAMQSEIIIKNSAQIESCSAIYGGAIYTNTQLSSSVLLDNSNINECDANSGGALYLNWNATCTLQNSASITNCWGQYEASAIYMVRLSNLIMSGTNTKIENCQGQSNLIELNNSSFVMNDGKIINNGGVRIISATSSTVVLNGGLIENNALMGEFIIGYESTITIYEDIRIDLVYGNSLIETYSGTVNLHGAYYDGNLEVKAYESIIHLYEGGYNFTGDWFMWIMDTSSYVSVMGTIDNGGDIYMDSPSLVDGMLAVQFNSAALFNAHKNNFYAYPGYFVENANNNRLLWYSVVEAKIGTVYYRYLTQAINAVPTNGVQTTIYVLSNVTVYNTIVIPSTKNIKLYVEGRYSISAGGSHVYIKYDDPRNNYNMFTIYGTLTVEAQLAQGQLPTGMAQKQLIFDGQKDQFEDDNFGYAMFYLEDTGKFIMNAGTVIQNHRTVMDADYSGVAVKVEGGTFVMNGGSIRDCMGEGIISLSYYGESIYGSTFEMYGGSITDCYPSGDPIIVYLGGGNGSQFILDGGTIDVPAFKIYAEGDASLVHLRSGYLYGQAYFNMAFESQLILQSMIVLDEGNIRVSTMYDAFINVLYNIDYTISLVCSGEMSEGQRVAVFGSADLYNANRLKLTAMPGFLVRYATYNVLLWYSVVEARIETTYYRYLTQAIDAVPANGVQTTIDVLSNVTVYNTIVIPENKNIKLYVEGRYIVLHGDGNIYIKYADPRDNYNMFIVRGILTIEAFTSTMHPPTGMLQKKLIFDGQSNQFANDNFGHAMFMVEGAGQFIMNAGTIIQNHRTVTDSDYAGVAVKVEGGIFTMNGGVIRECYGEGIISLSYDDYYDSFFVMNGGTIENCYVYTDDLTFAPTIVYIGFGNPAGFILDGGKIDIQSYILSCQGDISYIQLLSGTLYGQISIELYEESILYIDGDINLTESWIDVYLQNYATVQISIELNHEIYIYNAGMIDGQTAVVFSSQSVFNRNRNYIFAGEGYLAESSYNYLIWHLSVDAYRIIDFGYGNAYVYYKTLANAVASVTVTTNQIIYLESRNIRLANTITIAANRNISIYGLGLVRGTDDYYIRRANSSSTYALFNVLGRLEIKGETALPMGQFRPRRVYLDGEKTISSSNATSLITGSSLTANVIISFGVILCNNKAVYGGAIRLTEGYITLYGSIENCYANNGGAISYSGNGVVSLVGGTISDCASTNGGSGGAIYVSIVVAMYCEVQIEEGATITNCSATYGGAISIWIMDDAEVQCYITNSSITGCSATYGGAIHADSRAQGDGGYFSLYLSNATITGCSATYGGAIYQQYSIVSEYQISLVRFLSGNTINCSATSGGSLIYVSEGWVYGQMKTYGILVDGNNPDVQGEIYFEGGSDDLIIKSAQQSNNAYIKVNPSNGVLGSVTICVDNDYSNLMGVKLIISNSSSTALSSTVYTYWTNTARTANSTYGIIKYPDDNYGLYIDGKYEAKVGILTYTTVALAIASISTISSSPRTITLTRTRIFTNTDYLISHNNHRITFSKLTYNSTAFCYIYKTTAAQSIFKVTATGATLTINSGIILTGTMVYSTSTPTSAISQYSLVTLAAGTGTFSCIFEYGYANYGGGLCIYGNATANISSAIFRNCSAYYGGAICVGSPSYTTSYGRLIVGYSNMTISNCKASYGGGVYVYSSSASYGSQFSMMVSDQWAAIENCTAVGNGGGIYSTAYSNVELFGIQIQNCSAQSGGGVYTLGTFIIDTDEYITAKIDSCTASSSGGGIYSIGANSNVHIYTATISNCIASSNGGGIYCSSGNVYMYNASSVIEYCTANGSGSLAGGGGIYNSSGNVCMYDGYIRNNKALNGGGGAIHNYNHMGSSYTAPGISGGYIYNNTALYGGGIYTRYGSIYITKLNMYTNTATQSGGAIYIAKSSSSTIAVYIRSTSSSRVNIYNNSAGNRGGGVYNAGYLTVENGVSGIYVIRNNTDASSNGNIDVYNSTGCTSLQAGAYPSYAWQYSLSGSVGLWT